RFARVAAVEALVHGALGGRHRRARLARAGAVAAPHRRARSLWRRERLHGLSGTPRATPPRSIRAAGAAFTYAGSPRPAFRDLELEVEPGTVLLVVGPSGSGKSTLARAIAGLVPWQFPGEWQGSLRVGDVELARNDGGGEAAPPPSTPSLGTGIVFQDPASQLVMERVGDDVAFGLENLAWPRAAMRPRVREALAGVGLAGFDGRRSTRLSGGEQQRVALAGVLAPGPGVLVVDEPTAQLDPLGATAVFKILRSLRERQAATIVLVEHRAALAWPLADVVIALDDEGRPIDSGPPSEVLPRSGKKLATAGIWLPDDAADPGDAADPPSTSRAAAKRAADSPARRVVGDDPVLEVRGLRFGFSASGA